MTEQTETNLETNKSEEILTLSPEEEFKIKTICEFLFFDQYTDYATYTRFEQCFQPLLNDINISTDKIFKEIAGKQKKYITYKRFIESYLSNKNKTRIFSKDSRSFFEILMTSIIHDNNSPIGNPKEKVLTFSTTKSNRNRLFISLIEVVTDKNGVIHGLNLKYDDQIVKEKLYPKSIEDKLLVSIELNLSSMLEENSKKMKITKEKEIYLRDYVTHIFGTFNKNSETISFLGFKCVSGKTVFVGAPSGEGFIFGGWGKKFHQLRIQMTEKGITYMQPIFNENPKLNYYIKTAKAYSKEELEKDELILDEPQLAKLTDEIEIDKFITTPIISDDLFFNPKLKDEITGSDYKEIVNQAPRQWLLPKDKNNAARKFLSLNEAIKIYDEEKQKRDMYKEKEKKQNKENENKKTQNTEGNNEEKKVLRTNKESKLKKKKLHKTKKLNSTNSKDEEKWDGDVENVKPSSIFMSRENYRTLKSKLAQSIMDELKEKDSTTSNTKEYLIEIIIPEIAELKGNTSYIGQQTTQTPNLNQKKIHQQVKKLTLSNNNSINKPEAENDQSIKKTKKVNLTKIGIKEKEKEEKEIKLEDDSIGTDNTSNANTIPNKEENETENQENQEQNEANKGINDKTKKKVEGQNKNNIVEGKDGTRKYYSDALQIFNELANNDNNEEDDEQNNNEDNLFGFGMSEKYFPGEPAQNQKKLSDITGVYNYSSETHYTCDENHSYYTSGSSRKNNNKTYNLYNNINTSISDNMKNKNQKFDYNYLLVNIKYKDDPERMRLMQNNWRYFSKEIKRVSGVYLLQTIGTILKTVRILKNDITSEKKLPISEKIKLFKLLEENEAVVEFLNKKDDVEDIKYEDVNPNYNTKIKKYIHRDDIIEEEDEVDNDDFMLPDEHPEETLSLNDLEEKLRDISILLENKKLRPEQKKKIAILKNLFLQQKNIFVENETKKVKKEIINNNKDLNVNGLIQTEASKRKKAEKEDQEIIEKKTEQIKKEPKEDRNNLLSLAGAEVPNKIYRKQNLCKTSGNWSDFLFGPQIRSLCPYNSKGFLLPDGVSLRDIAGWNRYKWSRPEDIFDTPNYIILPENIYPNDIIQGCLNDSYFTTVLGSLCKCPKIIEKLFFIKEKTKEHIYGVYFNIHGQWKLVLLDDFFPVTDDNNVKNFAFSHCRNNEIWANLLEKAWAKVNGCYAAIGGKISPYEIYDILTEAYTEVINLANQGRNNLKENIWKKISDADKKGFVIIAVSNNNSSVEKIGLVRGNTYIISNIYEINNEKLLKITNPWEEVEYSGDWGDNSSKWNQDFKKKVNFKDKKEGDFFISFNDFVKYYSSLGIVKIHENYLSNSIRIQKSQSRKCQLIKIKVLSKDCHTYLQLYQKNPRIILSDGTYQKPVLSYLILTDKNFNYITSMTSNNMHICVEYHLDKGDYYLFSDINYRYINQNQKVHGYNITSYSKGEIVLDNITEEVKVKECLQKAMITYCKKKSKPSQMNNVSVYFTKSFNDDLPFVVGYFENNSSTDNKVSIDLKCRGAKSCCFYCDDIATEDDECIIKDLPSKKNATVLVMKYSMTSLFTIDYLITSNVDKLEVKKKAVDNSKKKTIMLKNSLNSKILDSNIVFNEEGQPLEIEPKLKQYILEINDKYIIGLENTANKKMKLRLVVEGLELTDATYKGRNSPLFYIDPKEKKTFNAVIKNRFNGELSFRFEFVTK